MCGAGVEVKRKIKEEQAGVIANQTANDEKKVDKTEFEEGVELHYSEDHKLCKDPVTKG